MDIIFWGFRILLWNKFLESVRSSCLVPCCVLYEQVQVFIGGEIPCHSSPLVHTCIHSISFFPGVASLVYFPTCPGVASPCHLVPTRLESSVRVHTSIWAIHLYAACAVLSSREQILCISESFCSLSPQIRYSILCFNSFPESNLPVSVLGNWRNVGTGQIFLIR